MTHAFKTSPLCLYIKFINSLTSKVILFIYIGCSFLAFLLLFQRSEKTLILYIFFEIHLFAFAVHLLGKEWVVKENLLLFALNDKMLYERF